MSSPGKFTVREVKKRSKKSRTLPVRLKLLNRGSKSGTPPPPSRSKAPSNLSIFKNANGEPWSFDLDAYGIYMDLTSPVRSVSKEELSTRPKSVIGYEEFNRVNRSKSLTRADAERQQQSDLHSTLGCSGLRSRSRSRLQNMNASFTQCFGFGNNNTSFDDEYCEYDSEDFEFMTGERYATLRSSSRNIARKLSFEDDDQYYPSG